MIRLLISVAKALAVATSAEAMSPAPLHEPDAMITQVRKARWVTWPRAKCWDLNQRVINGICVFDARPVPPTKHKCIAWWEAFALSTMGRSRGGGQEGEVAVTCLSMSGSQRGPQRAKGIV